MNYCEQCNNPLDNSYSQIFQKKQEKNKLKSADILKETSKNSYTNKYLGDYSRNKLNSKNSSNTNLKVKFDIKDKNKKAINKKAKNNSMDKNSTIELHNKFFEADKNKKKKQEI